MLGNPDCLVTSRLHTRIPLEPSHISQRLRQKALFLQPSHPQLSCSCLRKEPTGPETLCCATMRLGVSDGRVASNKNLANDHDVWGMGSEGYHAKAERRWGGRARLGLRTVKNAKTQNTGLSPWAFPAGISLCTKLFVTAWSRRHWLVRKESFLNNLVKMFQLPALTLALGTVRCLLLAY